MKILYIVSRPLEINTSASIRNIATIEGLIELGHKVDLITTEPDIKHTNYDHTILNNKIQTTYIKLGGVQNLAKLGRRLRFLNPLKRKVYNCMSKFDIYDNLKGIVNHADEIDIDENKYDIIISSSDPKSSHLFVSKIFESGEIKNTPWIQIWGDPFLSDITRKNKFLNLKIKKEENRLLKYATKVVYVSNLTLQEQKIIYPNFSNKMFYYPIPYVKEEIYPKVDLTKESLTFLYCGDYSSKIRNIRPLYEAIKKSKHKLIICGNSDIRLENTERIKVYPRVSYERTKDFQKECDILVHLSNLKGTQIPGKIYQYSGTNKLIAFILDGKENVLNQEFSKYSRYAFCQNSIKDISRLIDQIGKGKFDDTREIVKDFSPQIISKKIITINS